jgi:hypothetical protein
LDITDWTDDELQELPSSVYEQWINTQTITTHKSSIADLVKVDFLLETTVNGVLHSLRDQPAIKYFILNKSVFQKSADLLDMPECAHFVQCHWFAKKVRHRLNGPAIEWRITDECMPREKHAGSFLESLPKAEFFFRGIHVGFLKHWQIRIQRRLRIAWVCTPLKGLYLMFEITPFVFFRKQENGC